MAQIYGALTLLGVYFGVALLILVVWPNPSLSEIAWVCNVAGLPAGPCHAAATNVAAQGLIAIGMVTVATIAFTRKSLADGIVSPRIEPFEQASDLMIFLLAAITAVLVVHNVRHELTGLGGQHYRPAESPFVSMESLAWPLLLQLILWGRQIRWKFVLAGFLAALAVISPFRNTIFSIFYFGMLIPFGTMLVFGQALSRRTKLISFAALPAVVLVVSLVVLYQTGRRLEGAEYEAGPDQTRVAVIERGLASRSLTPFFQAVLADRLVQSQAPLPGFLASIAEKVHLGTQNLNEYVFNAIYYGSGQTTTLYYGESVANTAIPPLYWEFAAALALVLTYFLLLPVCDVGVLIALALWRSSMGGLFDVATALVLQVGFCVAVSRFQPLRKMLTEATPWIRTTLRSLLAAYVCIVVGWSLAVYTSPLWRIWEFHIDPDSINHEIGDAYQISLKGKAPFLSEFVSDSMTDPRISTLKLFEDGKPLGPPHSQHADIRAEGGGRFSHWYNLLYFAASDGSDPRLNGREYIAIDRPHLIPAVWTVTALLDLSLLAVFWWLTRFVLWRRSEITVPASAK